MTSAFKSPAMSFSTALSIINKQSELALQFRRAFLHHLPESDYLSDRLCMLINNDVDPTRLTAVASLAYHAIVKRGRWDDPFEDAREVANTVACQFCSDPYLWNGLEPLGYFFARAVGWRSLDLIKKNHKHHDGRIHNRCDNQVEGDYRCPAFDVAEFSSLPEHAFDTMRKCVYDLVKTFPDNQKLIATELILKPDGMTGAEVARVLKVAPSTVAGHLKNIRTEIVDYVRELELSISA